MLPPVEADRLLEDFAPTSVVVPRFAVTVPTGGVPVTLPFANDEAAEEPADAQSAAPPPEGEASVDPAPAEGDGQGSPLPAGLLVVMTDRDIKQRTIRYVGLTVQRPRRYLQPRIGYDPERERITIHIAPVDRRLLPAGNIRIRATVQGDVPPGAQIQLEAEVNAEQTEAQLFAPVPADRQRTVQLVLEVDGYPRAFVYDVPCWSAADDIPEKADLMDVQITGLPQGRVYGMPAGNIPVQLRVDAPAGSFGDGEDAVYVGLDEDRDRELTGERRVHLRADRQVELFLDAAGPDGRFVFESSQ